MIVPILDSLLNVGGARDTGTWPVNTRLLSTARGTLRLLDTGGKRPTVVMVPDGPNVIEHHRSVIERLAPYARVICFDMPDFGFSRPSFGYAHRVTQGAEIVLAVIDTLELREASLAFSCANGFYAIAAARLAPHESLLDLVPQAQITHFPDCAHFPDLEQPQVYSDLALAALEV